MPAKNISGDSSASLCPSHRRLFHDMIAAEVRMRSDILLPLVSKNNVGLGLVGEDQKQFCLESLREDHRMIKIIGVRPVPPATTPRLLRHAIDPMADLARTTHQHGVAQTLNMQVLRYDNGFVAFHSEIEETHSTRERRGCAGTVDGLAIDYGGT